MPTRALVPWAVVKRGGIPPLFVTRVPLQIGFGEPLPVGAAYPPPDPKNFREVARARQYYVQRRIGLLPPASTAAPGPPLLPPLPEAKSVRPSFPTKKKEVVHGTREI